MKKDESIAKLQMTKILNNFKVKRSDIKIPKTTIEAISVDNGYMDKAI